MAATSKTQIANLALSHIRDKGTVENVYTENTPQAKAAKLWYDVARRQVLADSDWGFARARLTLALHGEDPPSDWSYRYQVPADCVQHRRIVNPLGRSQAPVPYFIEYADDGTQSLVTDAEEAVLIYTRDAEDPAVFPPYFVLALSYLLAHYLAGPLTGKKSIQEDMLKAYNTMLNTGAANDANNTASSTEGWPEASWIQER